MLLFLYHQILGSKYGNVSYGNCISYTGGGSALSEGGARHGGEPGELPGNGQDAMMGGRPGNRSLSIAAVCRTEPTEMTGRRGEPFEE